MPTPIQLFAGTASKTLGQQIAAHYGQPLGTLHVKQFNNGELYPQFINAIQGAHVQIIQSTYTAAHWMELLLIIDAARRSQARCITVVAPYLGYMRQDSARHTGSSVGAQLQAQLLTAAGMNQLITCDLHTPKVMAFFDCPVQNLNSTSVFFPCIQPLQQQLHNLSFVAPDAGSVANATHYAQHFRKPLVCCEKTRTDAEQRLTVTVHGDVKNRHTIIVDDMVDTAQTLVQTAKQLKAQGAYTVRALCTHPVLSKGAYATLENSAIDVLMVTDTIPLQQPSSKIKVCSIAPLLADALRHLQ